MIKKINWEKFKEGLTMIIGAVNSNNVDCACCPYYGLGMCEDGIDKEDAVCNINEKQIDEVIDICKNKGAGN